jgi:hypothetical protein
MALNPIVQAQVFDGEIVVTNLTDNFGINGNPTREDSEVRYEFFQTTDGNNKVLIAEFGNVDTFTYKPTEDGIYSVTMIIEGEELCLDDAEVAFVMMIDDALKQARSEWLTDCDEASNFDFIRAETMRRAIDALLEKGMIQQAGEVIRCLNDFLRIRGICDMC